MTTQTFTFQLREPVAGGGRIVALGGVLSEGAGLQHRLQGLTGTIVFDLDDLHRITSFGVRDWLTAFRDLRADYYAFIRCRPSLVAQFNMVHGFAADGELVSLFAPYSCPACRHYFESFIDLRYEHDMVARGEPPPADCPACGAAAEFEDLPDDYFSYLMSRRRPHVSHAAQRLIDGRDSSPNVLRIRKTIEGSTTSVTLAGSLVASPGLARKLEGLEGIVAADLAGIDGASSEGFAQIGELLVRGVSKAWYRRVRPELIDSLRPSLDDGPRVASLLVSAPCQTCRSAVEYEIGFEQIEQARASGGAPALCPRCESTQLIAVTADVLSAARGVVTPAPGLLSPGAAHESIASAPVPAGQPRRSDQAADAHGIVGASSGLASVVAVLSAVAPSDVTVLLRGETGTGKEMLARTLHQMSDRRAKPFVAVNCAALPEGLVESELFGHEAGAFTGAATRNIGRFERANGGTLFIDEVGDLSLTVQVKLLRVLQEGAIERVGGRELIHVDVRLIAATHRDLESQIESGEFREDLYYRLNVVPISIPPLRERRQDVWPLAQHYLTELQARHRKTVRVTPEVRAALEGHDWPGNVRELINVVERIVALTPDGEVARLQLPRSRRETPGAAPERGESLRDALSSFERDYIVRALERAGGNRSLAARELGISRQALNHKLQKYDL